MQADAFLFEHLVGDGRRRGRRAPHLRPHAALAARARRAGAPGGAAARRHRHRRARRAARRVLERGGAPEARPHHPQLPEPRRLHALGGEAPRAAGAGARARLHWCSRTTPTSSCASAASGCPTMLSLDPERVVYASSFSKTVCPGIRVGYLVGPPELIAAIAKLATNTYISPEHGGAVDRVRVLRLGRDGALDRDRQDGAGQARAHAGGGAAPRAAGGRVRHPGGRLLHVGDAARGHRRRAPCTRPPPSWGWRS